MNKLFKKMIAFILIFAIMTTSINLSVFADIVSGPIMYNNTSYDTIEEAVNKATEDGDENPVIYLKRNIEFGGSVTLSENQHMTISSNDENKVVISFTCNTTKSDTFFTVPETANLTFQNIDVEGNRVKTTQEDGKVKYENKYAANKSFIIVKGKVVLNNTIFRNFSVNDDKSIFELNNGALEMDKNSGITECDNQGIYASNALIRVYNKGNITGGTVSNVRGWYDIGVGCVFYSNDLLEVSDVNISNVVIRVARAKEFTMNNCDISEIYSYGEAIDAEKLYIKNSKFYHNGSHYGTSTLAFDYGEIINTSFEKEYVRYGWTNILVRKRAVMAGVKFVNNRNDIKIEKNASVIVKEGKIDSEKFGKDIEVNSNELDKERTYIAENIKNTKKAYGIDIEEDVIKDEGTITQSAITANSETISNIPIVNAENVIKDLEGSQTTKGYYKFTRAQIGNYTIDDNQQLVYVTPREIASAKATYNNKTYEYTHGFGAIITSATSTTSSGNINHIQKSFEQTDEVVNVSEPRIYFGLETNSTVVTNSNNKKEFDYPTENALSNTENTYDGPAGLKANFLDRLVLSLREKDVNLLFSGNVKSDSKIITNRNIIQRAKTIMPYLEYDQNPYLVIRNNGELVWVLDAYTTSNNYPYSQRTMLENNGITKKEINYIRNSVKVIINAYTGEVTFYRTDKTDPIAMVYEKTYPDLFTKEEIPEDISNHFVYPEYLYSIQAEVLERYHNIQPDVFIQK